MKSILMIFLALHGSIHLMGFVKAFDILPVKQLKLPISKLFGLLWLTVCVLCFTCVFLMLVKASEWWAVGLAAIH